jgi:site-specific DNA-methyltransferase (adenine-specific)
MTAEVITGDCLIEMPRLIERGIKVDACIADVPYGTTACSWDSVIPFAPMWANLKALCKKNAAIVLFGSQPFTSALVMSNPQMFRCEWIWDKVNKHTNFFNANRAPMRRHENVLVFSQDSCVYNPQKEQCVPYLSRRYSTKTYPQYGTQNGADAGRLVTEKSPHTLLSFEGNFTTDNFHPTQKPVELMRYLVRTYSNEGDTILDFTCGSGSTGVASVIENRNFIGIEKDEHYAEVARARIKRASGEWAEIPRKGKADRPAPLFDREVVNF